MRRRASYHSLSGYLTHCFNHPPHPTYSWVFLRQRQVPEADTLPRPRNVWHHGQSLLSLFCQAGGGFTPQDSGDDQFGSGQRICPESEEPNHHPQPVSQLKGGFYRVSFVNKRVWCQTWLFLSSFVDHFIQLNCSDQTCFSFLWRIIGSQGLSRRGQQPADWIQKSKSNLLYLPKKRWGIFFPGCSTQRTLMWLMSEKLWGPEWFQEPVGVKKASLCSSHHQIISFYALSLI